MPPDAGGVNLSMSSEDFLAFSGNLCEDLGRDAFHLQRGSLMDESPNTRPSLLFRIRDARDRTAWEDFVGIYTPFVHRLLRGWGLQDADAADVTQDVFMTVVNAIDGFEHRRPGSFRCWLRTTARNRFVTLLRKNKVSVADGSAVLNLLEEQPSLDRGEAELLEREYQRCVLKWAIEQITPEFNESPWQAFWQTHIEGKSVQEVAKSLGVGESAVYMARIRVLKRLKAKIQDIEQ